MLMDYKSAYQMKCCAYLFIIFFTFIAL